MKCDCCGKHEATIHEVVVQGGEATDHHLCEQCAAEAGLHADPLKPLGELLTDFLLTSEEAAAQAAADVPASADQPEPGQMLPMQPASGSAAAPAVGEPTPATGAASGGRIRPHETVCSGCGLRYNEFRRSGLLGCPKCYYAFAEWLSPLLERAQQGGSFHIGKIPKRALDATRSQRGPSRNQAIERLVGSQLERTRRLSKLGTELDAAIAAEEFERAARLRDELERLTTLSTAIHQADQADQAERAGRAEARPEVHTPGAHTPDHQTHGGSPAQSPAPDSA